MLVTIVSAVLVIGARLGRAESLDLATIQISNQDIPAGYVPLDRNQLAIVGRLGFQGQQSNLRHQIGAWMQPASGRDIVAIIVEESSEMRGQELGGAIRDDFQKSAQRRFRVPEIDGAEGFVQQQAIKGVSVEISSIMLRRSTLVFIVCLVGNGSADEESVIREIALRQAKRAPYGDWDLSSIGVRLYAGILGSFVSTLGLYLFIANRIARSRDPLRPPKTNRQQAIKLLQSQIAEGAKLLSLRPFSSDSYKNWERASRYYIKNAFGGDFKRHDIGKSPPLAEESKRAAHLEATLKNFKG